MKSLSTLLLGTLFLGTTYVTGVGKRLVSFFTPTESAVTSSVKMFTPLSGTSTNSVDDIVTKALYFKGLLTSSQQSTLQQTYTTSLARKWSNLPCGSGCRNGIQLGTLTSDQLGAALEVIKAAMSTVSNEGYNEFYQIRLADYVLGHQYSANGYDSTIYFLAFLNTPSTTGQWMLQFGGHHYASNIGFNGGKVVGPMPQFRGVESSSFTVNGTTYAPLNQELSALQTMLASFTSAQLTTAKNSGTFSDCVMVPGETNGGTSAFPAKAGILCSALNSTQQALVLAAMEPYLQDLDDASAATLRSIYTADINSTYVTWTGSGTSGNASSFLIANSNYVRIDGPSVWIEFACQNGVVISNQIHYHTVFRDHVRDYAADLTLTSLPVLLTSFSASLQGNERLISWKTVNETAVRSYEIQRAADAASFTTIATVAARNGATNFYSFSDGETMSKDVIYYRLKITDADGNSRYSNVVAVRKSGGQNAVAVYPNPAKDKVTVSLLSGATNATLNIVNGDGVVVYRKAALTGNNFSVDVSGFAAGAYIVQVEQEGKTAVANFVKR